MPYFLSPIGNAQTIDANGDPLVGGTIETYLAGTTTPETTYTDDTGGTAQGVVMSLNSLGLPTNGPVWLLGSVPLKFIIKNALGVTQSTFDDISGIGDTSSAPDQFPYVAGTPTYISAVSFSLAGDQTNDAQISRRIRSINNGGTIYSTITNSAFGAGITTITVANDSGVLDAGLSQVNYSLLTPLNPSVPTTYAKSGANSDITSLSAITSINGGPIGGSRNRLINGNFGINQRGYVSGAATTAGQYTLDRWKVTGTGGITFSTVDNVTTVTIPSGQTLQQVIEGVNLQSGTHVLSWSGTAQGRIDGGAYGASGAVTATAVGGTNMTVEFNTGTVSLAQLEEGSLASRFEQRLIGVELALCQRYYQVTPADLTIQTSTASTNNDLLRVPFRETMRTAPTVSAINGSGTLTFVSGASGVNGVLYRFDVSGAGVGAASGAMTASAEL